MGRHTRTRESQEVGLILTTSVRLMTFDLLSSASDVMAMMTSRSIPHSGHWNSTSSSLLIVGAWLDCGPSPPKSNCKNGSATFGDGTVIVSSRLAHVLSSSLLMRSSGSAGTLSSNRTLDVGRRQRANGSPPVESLLRSAQRPVVDEPLTDFVKLVKMLKEDG